MKLERPPTQEQLNRIIELLLEVGEKKINYLRKKYGINFAYIPNYEYADRIIAILESAKERDISEL